MPTPATGALHATLASTRTRRGEPSTPASPPQAPAYLAPKRQRRAYGDTGIRSSVVPLPAPVPGCAPTINATIHAMLNAHALDWAVTQRENCRIYLLSETGRFQQWCAAEGLEKIDQLTTAPSLAPACSSATGSCPPSRRSWITPRSRIATAW